MPNNNINDFVVSGSTRVFAIIGDPLTHSLSPVFWNAAFRASALNAVYVPLRVSADSAESALRGLAALNVVGVNITSPLKKKAAAFCCFLHKTAAETGAVNTIKFTQNGNEGWNTDATGLARILNRLPAFTKAMLMGSGASASSALWALNEVKTAEVFQIARSFNNNEIFDEHKKSQEMLVTRLAWNNKNFAYAIKESDIIINTTPLGWSIEDKVPEFEEYLDKSKIYVDFNYGPASQLVAAALKNGCDVFDGRELLFEQGLESFRLLTGLEPPETVIRNCIYS